MTDRDEDVTSDEGENTSALRAEFATEQNEPVRQAPRAGAGVERIPTGSALLIVTRGPNAGSRFLLDRPVTAAGRHPQSDIFLDDVTVSRRHAQFRVEKGEFNIVDVGSLNGTYVNREPVESAALANGDEIQIGKFRLTFVADADAAETH